MKNNDIKLAEQLALQRKNNFLNKIKPAIFSIPVIRVMAITSELIYRMVQQRTSLYI